MSDAPHDSDIPPVRDPCILVILIEVQLQRWTVAALNDAGAIVPLLQSEAGDLSRYIRQPLDEQLSFLRHRLCGVLQRANDRIYARNLKASQIIFVCDHMLEDTSDELTQRLADHFVEWLSRPPVTFFVVEDIGKSNSSKLRKLAGTDIPWPVEWLQTRVSELLGMARDTEPWEIIPRKP